MGSRKMTQVRGSRRPAGVLIGEAIPGTDGSRFRPEARRIVEGEFPNVNGKEKQRLIELWRRKLQRWVNGQADWVSDTNAAIVARYLALDPNLLTRPVLSEDERLARQARRWEEKARELRRQIRGT